MGISTTTLKCKTPRIPLRADRTSAGGTLKQKLNYTVVMDNISRIDGTNPDLFVHAVSDPVFTEIEMSDRVYVRGSREFISILVSFKWKLFV